MPLVLAVWLFRRRERRSWFWWPVFVAFVVFLPNAAYTLTDVIHFVSEVQKSDELPVWSVVYIIIPKYAVFMFVGFQSHVISLILVGVYLAMDGPQKLGLRSRNDAELSLRDRRLLGTLLAIQQLGNCDAA